jgi:hypothetical protein
MTRKTDRGLIGWLEREEAERNRIPRASIYQGRSLPAQAAELQTEAAQAEAHVRHAAVLEKLARDFGPETAKLAAELAEREREARIPWHRRDLAKLLNAGRYGFR